MAKTKKQPPVHHDDFTDTMLAESDRGSVLIACHVLDVALAHSLRSRFRRRRIVVQRSVDPLFEPTRPLSSFSAKVHLAYALGLIDDWAYEDLQTIRALRNALAHSFDLFAFSSTTARPIVHRLHSTRHGLAYPKRPWSVGRTHRECERLATEWNKAPEQVFFHLGFHYLHGYLTKGVAYKTRKKPIPNDRNA